MATNPDDTRRQHEAEAAALALLLARASKRYDLPALIRANRIRPRQFRPIRPTLALKYDLAAPYYGIVSEWQAQTPGIVSAYAGGPRFAQAAVSRAADAVRPVVTQAQQQFERVVANVERFHRAQWIQRIKAATGLDVSMFTQPGDVAQAVEATVEWNRRLAADVSAQIEQKAAAEVAAGTAADLPVEGVAARIGDAVKAAKKRAARIGDDQIDKASRAMDRQRREAAGVTQYLWMHTQQPHPRHWHQARNGKTFGPGDIPADDRAGVPPFCKCVELPLLG